MLKRFVIGVVCVAGVVWVLTPPRLDNAKSIPSTITLLEVVVEPIEPVPISVHIKDVVLLPNDMMCPEWAQIAVDVGWREEDLPMLDYIIHRESRCLTIAYSNLDPNGGSYGLAQINGYWCEPSQWYPHGYLQAFGVLQRCDELFQPRINLLSAHLIWLYSNDKHGNGWLPWRT